MEDNNFHPPVINSNGDFSNDHPVDFSAQNFNAQNDEIKNTEIEIEPEKELMKQESQPSSDAQSIISEIKEEKIGNVFQKTTFDDKTEQEKKEIMGAKADTSLGPIKEAVYLIETNKIKPNPQQPRKYFDDEALKELADSIREYGILQPLVLTKNESQTPTGTSIEYQIIAGERRWRASKLLGLERVPAIIRPSFEERQKLEAAIIENIQRQDLNSLETARGFAKLADEFSLPQREIAQRIGKSREFVSNALRLLQLPSEAQRALQEGKITESHARVLLTVQNPEKQRVLLGEILSRHLTVRETEIIVKKFLEILPVDEIQRISLSDLGDPYEDEIENRLREIFGAKVEVKKKGDKGKITINFFSEEELNAILSKLEGRKS